MTKSAWLEREIRGPVGKHWGIPLDCSGHGTGSGSACGRSTDIWASGALSDF